MEKNIFGKKFMVEQLDRDRGYIVAMEHEEEEPPFGYTLTNRIAKLVLTFEEVQKLLGEWEKK